MGHHLNADNQFQSDKYPDLPANVVAITITPKNWPALEMVCATYRHRDPQFVGDLRAAMGAAGWRKAVGS